MLGRFLSILAVSLLLSLLSLPSFTLEEEIVLGREDGWKDFLELDGLTLDNGKWNTLDMRLKDGEYPIDGTTDLLVHFNRIPFRDETGRYRADQPRPLISTNAPRFGAGAGAFASGENSLVLTPSRGTLFDGVWGDFSLEFWLYPAQLGDGEVVLKWSGALDRYGVKVPQLLRCRLVNRKVSWDVSRFFSPDDETEIELTGITALLPRQWHHHLLRFDSATGMLEYLLDGIPEAVVYVTDTGEDGGSVLAPRTSLDGKLVLGERFIGLIDELRLSRTFVENPFLGRYPNRTGIGTSRIFDLGFTNSRLKSIEAVYGTPSNTDIFFYYRLSDKREHISTLDSPWIAFLPNQEIRDAATGRYLQLRVELMSDGGGTYSPVLSAIKITYEPDLPPPPPSFVFAEPGDGVVNLSWRKVNVADVKGYMIYYGFAPGKYTGTGLMEGDSPIDVSDQTRITLRQLENGRLYYFAVVSYDSSDPPHQSRFSMEVSARPSKVGRGEP